MKFKISIFVFILVIIITVCFFFLYNKGILDLELGSKNLSTSIGENNLNGDKSATGSKAESQGIVTELAQKNFYSYTPLQEGGSEAAINSYNDFYTVYNSSDGTPLVKMRSIRSLNQIFLSSCFQVKNLLLSKWYSEDEMYKLVLKKYSNQHLATIYWLMSEMSIYKDMKSTDLIASISFAQGQLLDNFAGSFSQEERSKMQSDLKKNIFRFKELNADTSNQRNNEIIDKGKNPIFVAYAELVLQKVEKSNKEVDLKNINNLNLALEKENQNSDRFVSYYAWGQIIRLGFMHENYKISKDPLLKSEIDKSIEKLIRHASSSDSNKDFHERWTVYFTNINSEMGSWDNVRQRMVELSKTNRNLKDFMVLYGYKETVK
jgi:hypothetical protein